MFAHFTNCSFPPPAGQQNVCFNHYTSISLINRCLLAVAFVVNWSPAGAGGKGRRSKAKQSLIRSALCVVGRWSAVPPPTLSVLPPGRGRWSPRRWCPKTCFILRINRGIGGENCGISPLGWSLSFFCSFVCVGPQLFAAIGKFYVPSGDESAAAAAPPHGTHPPAQKLAPIWTVGE